MADPVPGPPGASVPTAPSGLDLLVPGWPVPEGEGAAEPALDWHRGRAEPIEATLMRLLGLVPGEGGDVPSANAWEHDLRGESHAAMASAVGAGATVVRADPVHLSPDRDTALLLAPEAIGLTDAESEALVASLAGFVAEDGLLLVAGSAERWYLAGEDLPPVSGAPPQALSGRRVSELEAADGKGGGARTAPLPARWRALASELEMLLHAHPVNASRRARGALAVTGLHPHGAARPWRFAREGQGGLGGEGGEGDHGNEGPAVALRLAGPDPFAFAAASAAGVAVTEEDDAGEPDRPIIVLDRSLERAALAGDTEAFEAARARVAARWLGVDGGGDAGSLHAGLAPPPGLVLHAGGGRTGVPRRRRGGGSLLRRALDRVRASLG